VTVPPPDHVGHQDRVLMAEIGKLNEQLGHYILRYLAADALQAEPIGVIEERALAEAMVALASKVLERAGRRVASGTLPSAVEGESTLRGITNGRPTER
jgi:hypothetical protein